MQLKHDTKIGQIAFYFARSVFKLISHYNQMKNLLYLSSNMFKNELLKNFKGLSWLVNIFPQSKQVELMVRYL